MQRRQRFVADQRYDLPQHESMLGYIADEFQKYNKHFYSPQNRIAKNWKIINNGGLNVKVDQTTDSLLFNTDREGKEASILRKFNEAALTLSLNDNAINYVEVKIASEFCAQDTVALWDTTANGGNGEEFTQSSMTGIQEAPTLFSNTVAFTGDDDRLPLAIVTTAGGVITNIQDAREMLFHVDTDWSFGVTRTDKTITNLLDSYQALATAIKEVKGTPNWYDAPWPSNALLKEFQNMFFTDGGDIEFEGTLGANTLGWTAQIGIHIADRTNSYTINAQNVTINEGQAVYVTIPTSDVASPALAPVVANLSDVPIDPASIGYVAGIQVLFYRINNKIYGMMDIPEISSGEVVIIGESMSNNNKNRLGLTSDTAFVAYTSTTVIAANDSYPIAISKLDAASSSGAADVAALTLRSNQDRLMRLIEGGNLKVTEPVAGTLRLNNSASLFVEIAGIADDRNEIVTQNIDFTADDQVAYVSVNRAVPGVAGVLAVTVAAIDMVPTTNNIFIIARRINGRIIVGSLALVSGETKALDYTELDKFFGQLKISSHPTDTFKAVISGVDKTLVDSSILSQEMKNLVMDFDGAVIDFSTGVITKADGVTALGQNFTPFTIPLTQYFYYGIGIIPSVVNANNMIAGQVLITPAASANAVAANAPLPAIAGTKKLGTIRLQNVGGVLQISQIRQLGVGSGSGSGTGDANSFLEDLKARHRESFMQFFTPNIFSQQEDDLVDVSSTGGYDVANQEYDLTSVGQFLLTMNLLDPRFLENFADAAGVELHVLWNLIDASATYEASIDGGGNFSPITMERVGSTGKFFGDISSFSPLSVSLHEYALANANALKVFNVTTQQSQAMKITVASGEKEKVLSGNIYLNKLGSPVGDLSVRLVKDNAGAPSNAALDMLAEQLVSIGGLASGNITVPFDLSAILPAGDYWLVLQPSAAYQASYSAGVTELAWRTDTTSPSYTPSDLFIYNGTSWSVVAGEDATFQLNGFKFDLRIKITSGTNDVSLNGIGAFYQEEGAFSKETVQPEYQRFTVNGDDDQLEFTLTNFIPDPNTLKVYNGATAEALIYGDHFSINGQKVIFPAGTFLYPGKTFSVLFDQRMGFGQGNDRALAALASAGIGSDNGMYDFSSPGVGPVLKSPDGKRWKITVTNAGAILTTEI